MFLDNPALFRPLDQGFVRNAFELWPPKDFFFWAVGKGIRLPTAGGLKGSWGKGWNHTFPILGEATQVWGRVKDLGVLSIPPNEDAEFEVRRNKNIQLIREAAEQTPGRVLCSEASMKGVHVTYLDTFYPENQIVTVKRPLWTDPRQPDQFFRNAIEQLGKLYAYGDLAGFLLTYGLQKLVPFHLADNLIDEKGRVVCSGYEAWNGWMCDPKFLYVQNKTPDYISPQEEYTSPALQTLN